MTTNDIPSDELQLKTNYVAGIYSVTVTTELNAWQQENKTPALWRGEAALWTNTDENQWLGWLNEVVESTDILRIEILASELKAAGISDIVLIGMGGSSLFPVLAATTFGKIADFPQLHILDSTDPSQIAHLEARIELKNTVFIISSKSGTTFEPKVLKDYFYTRLQHLLHPAAAGEHFLAITDPETELGALAEKEQFKAVFYGVASIGGRFSALSNFGLVPLGLMGVSITEFLTPVKKMREACKIDSCVSENPGVTLGVILGVCARQGANKVTLIISPLIDALGVWLEQMLAESTGKEGRGLIPIVQETLAEPSVYGDDRVFIYLRLMTAPDPVQEQAVQLLEDVGFVVVRLSMPDIIHLGAELFRWQIATVVAGSLLRINPFNQPDVEDTKLQLVQLVKKYQNTDNYIPRIPFYAIDGIQLMSDDRQLNAMAHTGFDKPGMVDYLSAYLNQIGQGDYVNLSAFLEMTEEYATLLQTIRTQIRDAKKIATCLGFGPRYLHATGQAYKGGPNQGVFIQITADCRQDIQIPNHPYTFGEVIAAQAEADFNVLVTRQRRILRIHLSHDVLGGLQRLCEHIQKAL